MNSVGWFVLILFLLWLADVLKVQRWGMSNEAKLEAEEQDRRIDEERARVMQEKRVLQRRRFEEKEAKKLVSRASRKRVRIEELRRQRAKGGDHTVKESAIYSTCFSGCSAVVISVLSFFISGFRQVGKGAFDWADYFYVFFSALGIVWVLFFAIFLVSKRPIEELDREEAILLGELERIAPNK